MALIASKGLPMEAKESLLQNALRLFAKAHYVASTLFGTTSTLLGLLDQLSADSPKLHKEYTEPRGDVGHLFKQWES